MDVHPNPDGNHLDQLTDHLFRYEYGKMVATLTRILGSYQILTVEDIVQETLLTAIKSWRFQIPDKPEAWLYTVAKNKAIDYIKKEQNLSKLKKNVLSGFDPGVNLSSYIDELFLPHEISDSQLRMIFIICHPKLPVEGQIALTLKTLSGFSVPEIAKAFLVSESTINKRLFRAREKMRNLQLSMEPIGGAELKERLPSVLKVIYLMYNEGYYSNNPDYVIRKDLCYEAMRLCKILMDNTITCKPETFALQALMCFHSSRLNARMNTLGELILLKDQDRKLWDQSLIALGMKFLGESAEGKLLTTYHLQAKIASHYCRADSYNAIDWDQILSLYDLLEKVDDSPTIQLNRAIVLYQKEKFQDALTYLLNIVQFEQTSLYNYVLANIFIEQGKLEQAKEYFLKALTFANSSSEEKLISRRMDEAVGDKT